MPLAPFTIRGMGFSNPPHHRSKICKPKNDLPEHPSYSSNTQDPSTSILHKNAEKFRQFSIYMDCQARRA
jgi:hypothetical protein